MTERCTSGTVLEVDGNSYSVPWRLIGESVQVIVADGRVRVRHRGPEVAAHGETTGRRQRLPHPVHFHGVAGVARPVSGAAPAVRVPSPVAAGRGASKPP